MRILTATFTVLCLLGHVNSVQGQGDDPFAPGNPKAAAADPFAAPPANGGKNRSRQSAASRDALIQRAKQAIADGKRPVRVRSADGNEPEMRIEAALSDKTTITFIETPLSEAIQVISEIHDIPVVADNRALEEIGLSTDQPVSISLKNVTLRSALRLMLRSMDLTYLVKDEVLQITTVEAAEQNLILKMYVLPDNLAAKSDAVIKVMTATVVPDTWSVLGGPSSALAIDHVLVVSTTSDVQDRTQDFLAKLIEKYGK